MFETETRAKIIERLREFYEKNKKTEASSVEGTFAFDTFAANANEFEKTYAEMSLILDAAFPQTSWGKYLDYLAEELAGIDRRKATPAVVTLTLKGSSGATVPAGSLFSTQSGVTFALDSDAIIKDGEAEARATAQTPGKEGNVLPGSISKIPVTIYGISAVTNKEASYDGYDEETDSSLLERLLFAVRQPATSGNIYHYIEWATSVSGVGAVKVIPLWNGNGTVKVIAVDANKDTPSEDLLENVRNVIKENAPIGATVTVVAPTLKKIDISLKITNGKGNEAAIKKVLTDYFKKNVFGTNYTRKETEKAFTVSYAQVGRTILDNVEETGVLDYDDLKINGDTKNISIPADNMPVVGEVTLDA